MRTVDKIEYAGAYDMFRRGGFMGKHSTAAPAARRRGAAGAPPGRQAKIGVDQHRSGTPPKSETSL